MNNPIISVDGAAIPCPSTYQFRLEDISKSTAGRVESGKMHKQMIGRVISLELTWNAIPTAVVKQLLQAFKPEYISVKYIDPFVGVAPNYEVTQTFYRGNVAAPMYNSTLDLWDNLSFNIISRGGTNYGL